MTGARILLPPPRCPARRQLHAARAVRIAAFIAAVAPLLRGGRFRVFLDNLGCVFILGGVIPEAAIGGLAWGEYVTGGSPDPELQCLALQLFEAQLAGGFSL